MDIRAYLGRKNLGTLSVLQPMLVQPVVLSLRARSLCFWFQTRLADRLVPGAIVLDTLQSASASPSGPRICSACLRLDSWVFSTVSWSFSSEHNLYGLWSSNCLREGKQGKGVQTPRDYSLTWEERKSSIGWVAKSELNTSANSWRHRLRKGWADRNYFDRCRIWLEDDCIHRFKIDTQFIFASAEYLKHRSEARCWPRKLDIVGKTSNTREPAWWKHRILRDYLI